MGDFPKESSFSSFKENISRRLNEYCEEVQLGTLTGGKKNAILHNINYRTFKLICE